MSTILISGGTGMIGKALTALLLARNYKVIVLTRVLPAKNESEKEGLSYALWDVAKQTIDVEAVQKANYIIHLAGANVAGKRWTKKRKKEIVESRTQSSALLVKTLRENNNQVKAIVSASAIGWYGADPVIPNPHPFKESDTGNHDFLGDTCKLWEESIDPVVELGKRLVKLRTGIVLSKEGGALNEFIKPLRLGIAAILGNGKQMISWIHLDLSLIHIYEVEKVCTHVAIIKKGSLLTTGPVEDVLADEDTVEISAANLDSLAAAMNNYGNKTKVVQEGMFLQISMPKGTARLDDINSYCFSKGITLNHLLFKKKRLEAKFFELTNN